MSASSKRAEGLLESALDGEVDGPQERLLLALVGIGYALLALVQEQGRC